MIKQNPYSHPQSYSISFSDYQNILNNIFKQEDKFDSTHIIPLILTNLKPDQDPKTTKILIDILYALAVLCPGQVKKQR
jgi:hypothetical protein